MNLLFNDMDIVTGFEAVFTHKYKSIRNENVSKMNFNNNTDAEGYKHRADDYKYFESHN